MIRIAMFSGPRHRSTAMMRAWSQRSDTYVWDEPFYGPYLVKTGIDHPMRDDILRIVETDPQRIASRCSLDIIAGYRVFFQKHMTQHMLPDIGLDWLENVISCFLIRDPRRVLISYRKQRETVTEPDLGYHRTLALFEHARTATGRIPPVLDSDDIARDPEAMLRALCLEVGVRFETPMLSWPAGPQESDGVWGPHWYQDLWRSTGFGPPSPTPRSLPDELERLAKDCIPAYLAMRKHKLLPQT